jgi:uracil-DNA glycosylase family 4
MLLVRNEHCTLCPLHETAVTVCINGTGTGKLLVVGQNPGGREDLAGEPFIGRSGSILREMLADAGYKPDDYRLTNAVRCHSPNNRPPTPAEVNTCRIYLKEEIHEQRPEAIIALGDTALRSLLRSSGVRSKRGQSFPLHKSFDYECGVWPTYHPAYVLRSPQAKAVVVSDFRRVKSGRNPEEVPWEWWDGQPLEGTVYLDIETDWDPSVPGSGDVIVQVGAMPEASETVYIARGDASVRSLLRGLQKNPIVTHNGWAFDLPKIEKWLNEPR